MKSARIWEIFCKVVDNYGDIGVCWRLAADLAARGQRVRLWVDDPSALAWMAPGALEGRWPRVQVLPWDKGRDRVTLDALPHADVWIEGFGCDLPVEMLEHRFNAGRSGTTAPSPAPAWFNLEYLTAESFAERSHGLPSPLMHGPASGHTRYFFYPGFSLSTGGLLREPDLATRQANFDRADWLAAQGISWSGERLVSLFCYEPDALPALLEQLRQDAQPTRLLVTHGRAAAAVWHWQGHNGSHRLTDAAGLSGPLALDLLPPLSQTGFDELLWSCDLNFVRGEDSLVRAIWAGKPFVWQIYPQHDNAHRAKLEAFLDAMQAPPGWRAFHRAWNGMASYALPEPDLAAWTAAVLQARGRLWGQTDLSTGLLEFVARKIPVAG